jgi:hypothetical protein
MTMMPFGKHRGVPLDRLPDDYLAWLSDLDDLRQPLRGAVDQQVRRRLGDRESESDRPVAGPVDGDVAAAIVEAGRRALALKHHPDKGGDTAIMQKINGTADRLLGQFPRKRQAA